jgi:high affinity Mn2+ porin
MPQVGERFSITPARKLRAFVFVVSGLLPGLMRSATVLAQTGASEAAPPISAYDRGYREGYEAGLRAAKLAEHSVSGAPASRNKQPAAATQQASNEPSHGLAASSPTAGTADPPPHGDEVMAGVKSLWAEMTAPHEDSDFFFHHSQTSPFWLSAQADVIAQMHPRFHSPYRGPNSFNGAEEQAVSRVVTLFTGFQLNDTTELVLDAESSGWSGLSQALGLGAYVNLDVVRNPSLSAEPYLARLWLRKVIPLSDETVEVERNPLSLLTTLPVRRIDIHVGKMTLPDFLDINSVGGDSHMQFMNWAIDNNPAWDYAADTRGYTYAVLLDYEDRYWGARFAEALEPMAANGDTLEWNLQDAHSENFEVEFRPVILPARSTAIRFLGYMNHANMGNYHEADSLFEEQRVAGENVQAPNIDDHPQQVSMKYGFGFNAEQEITGTLRAYTRVGWNEGQHESWTYTECDAHLAFGFDLRGDRWRRPNDKWGAAFVMDGLSPNHRRYLSLGGLGFVLGDGKLSYGPEEVMETYYNFPVPIRPGMFAALDLQYINNPGYNRARGPVVVPGVRLHLEL